jgi:hypothetical protein
VGAILPEVRCYIPPPSITKRKADANRVIHNVWEASLSTEKIKNSHSTSSLWYSLNKEHIPCPPNFPTSTQVVVSHFHLEYRHCLDIADYQHCPCGKEVFSVAHFLGSCEAMDRSDISVFMGNPPLQKGMTPIQH